MARRTNLRRPIRNRREADRSYVPAPADVSIASATVVAPATDAIFALSGPVNRAAGVPAITSPTGGAAQSIVAFAGNSITVRFANGLAGGDEFTWPTNDPALRTAGGGFVQRTNGVFL